MAPNSLSRNRPETTIGQRTCEERHGGRDAQSRRPSGPADLLAEYGCVREPGKVPLKDQPPTCKNVRTTCWGLLCSNRQLKQ